MDLNDSLQAEITLQILNHMENNNISLNNICSTSSFAKHNGLSKASPSNSLNDLMSLSGSPVSRVSAEEMDEKRQQNIAYEYLCHLEEAKKWIESCIREELPSAPECEENLRNGIYLAKLANFFCPEKVPFKQIYDKDQSKYQSRGLHFKHTDNINHWFTAMEHIGLPKIFFPETTDIYDKKNMPRVVYCLHALSLYLYKLGIAPPIQDLYGVAKFTEEEITAMAKELQKYGLQLPAFSKIGGILAAEMPVDEAALHAAILAINDAIEKKDLKILLNVLKLYDARLYNVNDDFIKFYHEIMYEAKIAKSALARSKSHDAGYVADVYNELLTQTEIQMHINRINVDKLITEINECVSKQNGVHLLKLLKSKVSPFVDIIDKNIDWYMAQLTQQKETKLDNSLDKDAIQNAISLANMNSDKLNKCVKMVDGLNMSLINNKSDEFCSILKQNYDVFQADLDCDYAAALYFIEFKYIYDEKQTQLDLDDFLHGVKVLNAIVEINKTIDACCNRLNITMENYFSKESELDESDSFKLLGKLKNSNAHLQDLNNDYLKTRYLKSLIQAKLFKNNNILSETKTTSSSLSDSGHDESEMFQCCLLTHGEIQECVAQTNVDFEHECLAVVLINDSLTKDNASHTMYLIKNSIPRDDSLILNDLNAYIYHNEMKKIKTLKDNLTIEDIKSTIKNCNLILENALNMTKTMILLNQIDESRRNEIIGLIKDKSLGFKIYPSTESHDLYYQTFRDLKKICKTQPLINTEYFWNKTIEEYDFYFNLKNINNYSWTVPHNYVEPACLITRSILKKAIDAANEKFERMLLYKSKENLIVLMQARIRGYQFREKLKKRLSYLREHETQCVQIQSWWRMTRTRQAYKKRLEFFKQNTKAIIAMQAHLRMFLTRRAYLERLNLFKQNEKAIVKIQSFVRATRARNDYKSLIHDKNPPLRVVQKFVHLLEHNNTDFNEEIELQELKRQIMTSIKMNKNLEQDLDMMDVKIGLLVKNRITLQDVLMQDKKLKKYKEDIELNQTNHIKQLSKENHDKMELYQNLFYLLQTKPIYLAKLLYRLPVTNSSKFIESVVLQLFNYGANSREEYLLLKLFTTALEQEIESKVDKISDIITGTPLVIKVIVSLYRKHRGENVLRNLLNPIVEEFLSVKNLNLCLNPSDIYKSWINKLESDTGRPSGYPYDVSNQKALEYPEVRRQFDENLKTVKFYTAKFLNLILKSIKKIPYGLRFVAKVLRSKLKSKFPQATDREILKIVGNLVYYRFINSAVCSPDAYDVIDLKAGVPLDIEQRKNLACISKHLNLIAMSKGYGDSENAHLACMNPFIKESHEQIRSYFNEICNVPEAEEYFGINEYSDLIVLTKPVVYMTAQEICETHRILRDNLDYLAPDEKDPLKEIFSLLSPEPNLDSLCENISPRPTSLKFDTMTRNSFSKNTQLCLTLTDRFTPTSDEKTDINNLFIRTKRLIVEIIHCQQGDSMEAILRTPATYEQEKFHSNLLRKRAKNDSLLGTEHQKTSNSLTSSLETMKKEVEFNIKELIRLNSSYNPSNVYQLLISKIAQDIRNQRKHRLRRQKELVHLNEVYIVLEKKQLLLKEQVSYYSEYVKACLDSFNSKKGKSRNPFKRFSKEEKIRGTIKYSAAKLYDKGVILEIDGFQPNQFKNVQFEISTTDEPGIFEVNAKILGRTMEKFELVFQDLLQMQYEGASIMNMFGFAKINVNLLIFLLNKKFYGK